MKKIILTTFLFIAAASISMAVQTGIDNKDAVNGDIEATGYISGVKAGVYASLDASADTTVTTAGTYYSISGTFTNSPIEQFGAATVYTPCIKYTGTKTQYFEIDWHASIAGDAPAERISIGIKKNGAISAPSVMHQFLKTAGETFTLSGTVIVELAENDEIQLVLTSDSNGDVITVQNFTASINEFYD